MVKLHHWFWGNGNEPDIADIFLGRVMYSTLVLTKPVSLHRRVTLTSFGPLPRHTTVT